MGHFVKINSDTTKKYEAVSQTAFKNFLDFANHFRFQKLVRVGDDFAKETYFDTPNHLLNKSGIVLSKFQEGNVVFFKVENASFMSKVLNSLHKEVFVHQVGFNDKLSDHAFYIKDGITSMFSTAFSIDLENVIKSATPKLEVEVSATIYQLTSGTGMRAKIALENKTVRNLETKRRYQVQGLTIKLEGENISLFKDEFEKFNLSIQKNCKEFLLIDENQFDFANKVTKALPPKVKLSKEEKLKLKKEKERKNRIS